MNVPYFLRNLSEALALLRAGAAVLPPEAGHLVVRPAVPPVGAVDRPQQLQGLLVPPLTQCVAVDTSYDCTVDTRPGTPGTLETRA